MDRRSNGPQSGLKISDDNQYLNRSFATQDPDEIRADIFRQTALLNRELVLDSLSGQETLSITGLPFTLKTGGAVYSVSDRSFGNRAAIAAIDEIDVRTRIPQRQLVIKRLQSFTPKDTRILAPGLPSPEDGSPSEEQYKRAISMVRQKVGVLDWIVNKVVDYWNLDYSGKTLAELAEKIENSGGVNDPTEVHRARRPIREIAAHLILSRQKAMFAAYPGIIVPCAPELHDIYLRKGGGGALTPYLVMERVQGVHLQKYLEQEKNSETINSQTLDISCQILQQGMTLANYGIFHCDSAMRNVVADCIEFQGARRPLARLIDFGFVYLGHLSEVQGINGFADCDFVAMDAEYDRPKDLHQPLFNIFNEISRTISKSRNLHPDVAKLVALLADQHESWSPMSLESAAKMVVELQHKIKLR